MNFTRIFSYFFTCMYPYVSRMYPYGSRMYPYVYSYVSRMLLVCVRMFRVLLVCYPYVLVWCFSHDPPRRYDVIYHQGNSIILEIIHLRHNFH